MDWLTQNEQISMLGAFAISVREGWFSRDHHEVLVEGTDRGAISHVVQTFRAAGRQNPTKDNDRELSILLSRQYLAYKNKVPQQKQQQALPFIVFNKLAKRQVTELDIALGQLTIRAAFFTCHSYEYLTVPKREERCTKLLYLQNIRFFKDRHLILAPSVDLESADSIAITFEMQKNDSKFDTVIHGWRDDPVLCPVLQWAHRLTEFRANQTQYAIHRSVLCGAMKDSTRLHQRKYCRHCALQAKQSETHTLALSQARWGRTPFAQEQQWTCISPGYRVIPSCLLADGRATHFYVT